MIFCETTVNINYYYEIGMNDIGTNSAFFVQKVSACSFFKVSFGEVKLKALRMM